MRIFINLYLLYTLSACTNVLEVNDMMYKPQIVVNSLFTNDSTWTVRLTKSRSILAETQTSFEPIENARVVIADADGQIIDTLMPSYDHLFRFRYRGSLKPTIGGRYTILVETAFGMVTASSNVPEPVQIASVQTDSSQVGSDGLGVEVNILFEDPKTEKNLYAIRMIRKKFQVNESDTLRFVEDVAFEPIDPALQNNQSSRLTTLFNDNLFNGKEHFVRLRIKSDSNLGITESVIIVLFSVSEDYYDYFIEKNLQDDIREDPFAQPVEVSTNVKNGLGIFAGYSSSSFTIQ